MGHVTVVEVVSISRLQTTGETDVGERVESLAYEEGRLYAATPGKLVVFDLESPEP